jgi:hypothetical protein
MDRDLNKPVPLPKEYPPIAPYVGKEFKDYKMLKKKRPIDFKTPIEDAPKGKGNLGRL